MTGDEWTEGGCAFEDKIHVKTLLAYAEDVEAEALCDCFADQLIWKTVEAHVSAELYGSFVFILKRCNTTQ